MTTTMHPAVPAEPDAEEPRSRRKWILIVVAVLAVVAGGVWQFWLKPVDAEPQAGEVLALEPIQINLAGGHYLRLGIALQLAEGAEEVNGSVALDRAIDLFSGAKIEQVANTEQRRELKATLSHQVRLAYDEEVLEVYYTDFVTQ